LNKLSKNVETFIGCGSGYAESAAVIFGAPFDSTTSFRPGARFGPSIMRRDSWGLETYSPYQDRDLQDLKIFDAGDLELPFGNAQKALNIIKEFTEKILKDGKKPFLLGGEHLMTLGAFEAVNGFYGGVSVIHFDAHADMRHDYLGEKLSHACVMRRVYERLLGNNRIYQFGIRSGERNEFEFAERTGYINKFNLNGIDDMVGELKNTPVYVTVDLDVLDTSVFPGTGTPEPGGVSFAELLGALIKLGKLNVVGCDVVELAPDYDRSGISVAAACKVVREMLLGYI
jgi:agmatinase